MTAVTLSFVEAHADCWLRTCLPGHVTGSALIVDRGRRLALLTHHRKLGRWLQPGGHADGETDPLAVALREAREETGLDVLTPLSTELFDVDRHWIPARPGEPGHWHHDLRFLLEGDHTQPLVITEESNQLAWAPLDRLAEYGADASLIRMGRKAASFDTP